MILTSIITFQFKYPEKNSLTVISYAQSFEVYFIVNKLLFFHIAAAQTQNRCHDETGEDFGNGLGDQTSSPKYAVFQVTRRGCASTSEAGALPAASTATYKTGKDGLLPKHSQSLQSAKTPQSSLLPSLSLSLALSPVHDRGGDIALATQAQGPAAQQKVGHGSFKARFQHDLI